MATDPIVIVSAARTPIGGLLGDFSSLAAWELGATAIKAAVERAGLPGDAIDEVLMGNCLMAGQGQAPARQAMRRAGLPDSTGAVTLSKMCGSGMRAMMFAHDMLAAGSANVMLAGGMESMTNAPHLMFARKGVKYGAATLYDHMAIDGLEDAYERGKAMGVFAEQCVGKYGFTPRGDGPVRDRLHAAQQGRQRGRQLRLGDGTGDHHQPEGRQPDQVRRAALQGQAREDREPEARVQEGWRDHRRHLVDRFPTAPRPWS